MFIDILLWPCLMVMYVLVLDPASISHLLFSLEAPWKTLPRADIVDMVPRLRPERKRTTTDSTLVLLDLFHGTN